MPSLPRRSHLAPMVDTRHSRIHLQGWMGPAQCQNQHQNRPHWHPYKPQPGLGRAARGVVLQLLLGIGSSLVGSAAIAMPASAGIVEPVSTESVSPSARQPLSSNSVGLPPLAQSSPTAQPATEESESLGEAEAIEGSGEVRIPSASKGSIYTPIRLKSGLSIQDTLTTKDIPLGQGSFARDYVVTLKAEDQIAIDLFSDSFDTVVTLMAENGTTLGENDDGPEGGTNSLLFMRITEDGDYVVRVRGFGQAKGGPFKLKLTRLKASD